MKEKYIQSLGILLVIIYGFFILWLYWAAPLLGAALAVAANHFLSPAEPVETKPHQAQEFAPTGEGR